MEVINRAVNINMNIFGLSFFCSGLGVNLFE